MAQNAKTFGKAMVVTAFVLAGMLALASCSSTSAEMKPQTEGTSMGANESTATDAGAAYRKISAAEGQTMMEGGTVTIVDVRTPQEYAEKHIPGAINIPVESIGNEKPAELTDPEAQLIVYCRTGVRSKQASDKLVGLGYQHVNDMGGIVDWTGSTVSGTQPGA